MVQTEGEDRMDADNSPLHNDPALGDSEVLAPHLHGPTVKGMGISNLASKLRDLLRV